MYELFTPEWIRAYRQALNANEGYRQAAADWEWPLVLLVDADPARGLEEPRGIYLDLYRGECREARAATREDAESAPYVISGDLATWRQVIAGELELIAAMMRGKLRLERGDLAFLAGYMAAALELIKSAREVPTSDPEDR
ncbi:MAG: SCP2 sterol-binding domain-containing protein [Firmicutes bacterium]|nr:SCP2 sterol-binding domain-containing protein [Bacillota bacterium]